MSRCFPFPPPGYERQISSDHVELLAKEKQKEKKRKKEKKEKENREGKDKKEKDRSKDKHKDKKERKEKRKDKKKEREKDKNSSESNKVDKQNESHHYELGESSQKTKETNHSKFTEDLDRRIKDEQKVAASRMVESVNVPSQRNTGITAYPNSVSDRGAGNKGIQSSMVDPQRRIDKVERSAANLSNLSQRTDALGFANAVQKEKSASQKATSKLEQKGDALGFANAMQKEKSTNQKVAPKLEQKVDGLGLGNAQKERYTGQKLAPKLEQKGDVGVEQPPRHSKVLIRRPEGPTGTASAEKDNRNNKYDSNSGSVQRTINGMGQQAETLSNPLHENISVIRIPTKIEKKADAEKNSSKHNLIGQKDVDAMSQLMEKGAQRTAGKADNKEDQGRKEEKRKDKDRDHKKHKSKHKHKDKDKEKEKEKEKTNDKSERKVKEHGEIRDKKEDQIDGLKLKPLAQPDSTKNQPTTDNIKKRKEFEANGFLHENDLRLNKLPKTTPPSHHPVENGRRFQVSPVTTNILPVKSEATNDTTPGKLPVDNKNHTMNGTSVAQPLSSAQMKHPEKTDIKVSSGVSSKPHPDTKYLSKIYSIPKIEEWQEDDDQEWLFGTNQSQLKPQLTHDPDEPPLVWAEAQRIESADVIAMPYVIPF